MLLFESFTYDNSWASQYYDDFYDASPYIKQLLNDGFDDYGQFYVKQCYSKDHETYRYKIGYIDRRHIFCDDAFWCFPYEAYIYAYNKLKNFGEAITIDPDCFPVEEKGNNQRDIIINYYKEKDEKRWEEEHKIMDFILGNETFLECKPTLETWLKMLDNILLKKDPDKLFKKVNDLKALSRFYIVALKLDWYDAYSELETRLSEVIVANTNGFKEDQYFARASKAFNISKLQKALSLYATQYEIDQPIQKLMNQYKQASKHENNISAKLLPIAKCLDDNPDVRRYEFVKYFEYAIDIETTNGNKGRIYLDETDTHFWELRVSIEGMPRNHEKTAALAFKAIPKYVINPCVNAIVEKDPMEIHKSTIKYQG